MVRNLNHNQFVFPKLIPLFAATICIGIFVARFLGVFSFAEPMHIVTSGFEEESLFALWKISQHQAIYQDPHQLPFAASYFNWVFYGFYGQIISLLRIQDAWLPTVGRLISLSFVLVGFGASFAWFKHESKQWIMPFVLATVIFLGPLVGFWGFTVRPDLPAFVLEVLAVICYFYLQVKRPKLALFSFVLLCYLAWGFKQINVVMPGALGLYLLCHRQWRDLISLTIGYFALVGLTMLVAPPLMYEALTFSDTHLSFSLMLWVTNLSQMLIKTAPIWVMILGIFNQQIRKSLFKDNLVRFAFCGLLVWAIIILPASSKIGSSDNYHFTAMFFGALIALRLARYLHPNLIQLAWGSYALILIVSLWQHRLVLDLKPMHQYNMALKQCIHQYKPPVYIKNHYASLPWVSQDGPYFVTAYNYWGDRARDYEYEHDGIGGLIGAGFFNALLLPNQVTESFDHYPLAQYELAGTCQDMNVFVLKEIR